jgi:phenylacetate-CoA ligase
VTVGIRRPWVAVDFEELVRAFPPAPDYFDTLFLADPDELDRLKLSRAQQRVRQAAAVPFFAALWENAKVGPRDLQTLDDLWKFPSYDVDDIRRDIESHPPFGSYQGVRPELANREPQRVYFSGGTTGRVRPTLYTQWDREVSSLFMARALYRQGVRPGDIVLNSYQYSTFNGGALFDEAAHHWLNCIVISTSSGNVTSSEKQAQLAVEYGATCIMTTGDHLMRIVDVAKELGYDPRTDFNIRAVSGLGDRKSPDEIASILAAVGVSEFYDSYGFHEIGSLGVECPEHDGVHVFEEAYEVQIVDPETGERLPDGELGAMVVTEFFKTGSPQIRYNTLDLSWLYPREQCACGSWMRRIGAFSGRADNMVKLRGINIWPEAIGLVATDLEAVEPDYFVQARRIDGRDDMVISIVSKADAARYEEVARQAESALQQRFGLKFSVEVGPPGWLDDLTEARKAPKPKRFRDDRPIAGSTGH